MKTYTLYQSILRTLFRVILVIFLFCKSNVTAQPLSYLMDTVSLQSLISFEGGDCEFEFADINDDGYLDILSVGDHGSPYINTQQHGIMVFFGNGTGAGWTLFQNGNLGYGGVAVGDVNNDGFKDVGYGIHHNYATVDFGDQVLEVVLGDGTGMNWTPYDDLLGLNGQTWGMFGTDFADFNNDGLLDIGANSFGCCDGIHVHRNNGNGTWTQTFGFTGGNSSQWFQFGDIDNDGYMDFVAARQGGTVYFGDGTGAFTLKDNGLPSSGIVGYEFVDLANVDNDPLLELGISYGGGLYIYKWIPGTQQWSLISSGLPTSGNYYILRLADMNVDGIKDVVAFSPGMFSVFTGNGNNIYSPAVTQAVPNLDFPRHIAVADVDHSGRPDVLMFGRYTLGLFSSVNRLRLFRETNSATAFNINGILPDSGQCYPNGATRWITWNSTLLPSTKSFITLELSVSGGTGTWDTLATLVPDNGSFQWTVPTGVSSPYCYIRYTLSDSTGQSIYAQTLSQPFNIGCHTLTSISEPLHPFYLFPNPVSKTLSIRFRSALINPGPVMITDLSSRTLKAYNVHNSSNRMEIDVSALPAGTYLLHFSNIPFKGRFIKMY
jgi:hypothetical protein